MGLDTSHDCWHGPYSSFTRWRTALCEAAGIPTHVGEYGAPIADIDWEKFGALGMQIYQGEWPEGYEIGDPLLYLIVHSDCDGVIRPAEGRMLADRLEQLLPALAQSEVPGPRGASVFAATEQFIDGLRAAAALGEDVDFH